MLRATPRASRRSPACSPSTPAPTAPAINVEFRVETLAIVVSPACSARRCTRLICTADIRRPAGSAIGTSFTHRSFGELVAMASREPITPLRPAPTAATRATRCAATRASPRRGRSSSRGGIARATAYMPAQTAALAPTAKAMRAVGEACCSRPRPIERASDSIALWVTVTADRVVAEMTPVAIAWSMVRRGCRPGSNDGPTAAAAAKSAERSATVR